MFDGICLKPSTPEAEAGGSVWVSGWHGLHREFWDRQSYVVEPMAQ